MNKMSLSPEFLKSAVDVRLEEKVWQHPRDIFSVYRLQCKLPIFDSSEMYEVERTIVQKRPFSIVLPYDPYLDQVVMIEQIRMASVFTKQDSPCIFELCAGYVDEGESPKDAAKREVLEETGLDAQQLEFVCEYWVSPGWSSERAHFYCAQVDSSSASGAFGLPSEGESTKVHCMDALSFIDLVEAGQLDNGGALIGALWLSKHRERLLKSWQKKGSNSRG